MMKRKAMFLLFIYLCSTTGGSATTSSLGASLEPRTVPYPTSSLLKEDVERPLHRLIIINALNRANWHQETADQELLKTSFEKKLQLQLLRNTTVPIETTELALYISALIAGQENPRNYNSVDLVADLLRRVNGMTEIHPFLLLTLCNAHALLPEHVTKLSDMDYLNASTLMLAQSLKTLTCAATLPNSQFRRHELTDVMEKIAATLAGKQTKDGHFGDMYTSSLATQALTAYGKQLWRETAALDALLKETEAEHTNVVKAYYLASALNSRRVNFLKDLYDGSYEPERKVKQMYIYVHLAVKYQNSDVEFGLTVRVPNNWSVLQIMERAAELSHNFRFSYTKVGSETILYEVSGTPNDPEKNLFWHLCCPKRRIEEGYNLDNLFPFNDEHVELWYRTPKCPPVDVE